MTVVEASHGVPGPAKINKAVLRYAVLALLGWSVLLSASLAWNLDRQREVTLELVRNTAYAHFNKDVAYRMWASNHGGVYVPPTEKTPPSPWLSHIPDRDIVTASGRKLTLMNPAYMLREMMQDYGELYGIKGRIVGIVYLNPNNKADPWEEEAIRQFAAGTLSEKQEISEIDGTPHLRLFRPFLMEESCQKCHGHLGFKNGDVRGGIGVSVSLAPYLESERRVISTITSTHAVLWLLGVIAIVLAARRSQGRLLDAHRMTMSLQEKNKALESSNAELEAFAYVSSHDLREPLRNITSFSTLLTRRLDQRLDGDEREMLAIVSDAAQRMDELVRDLLELSRVGRDGEPFSPVDLGKAMAMAQKSLRVQIESSSAVITPPDAWPTVLENLGELSRVFMNLIANAIKYRGKETPEIRIACKQAPDGNWRLEFHDNGIGIEPGLGYEERIFGLFQRLHKRNEFGGGTGIGLTISRKIIERHGGSIWAESAGQDKGTVFFVTLPKGNFDAGAKTASK